MSEEQQRQCQACGLAQTCTQVVLPDPPTVGGLGLFAIGEAPGADEDRAGIGFYGRAGKNLDHLLETAVEGFPVSRQQFGRANIVCCRPPNNRAPSKKETAACKPWLVEALTQRFNVRVILAVGKSASVAFYDTDKLDDAIQKAAAQGYRPDIDWLCDAGVQVVPCPHTSALAMNRYCARTGEQWKVVARRQARIAIELARSA